MTTDARMSLGLLAAFWLQLAAWQQVTFHTALLALCGVVVALVLGTGLLVRRLGFGGAVVAVAQAAVAFAGLVAGLVALHGVTTLGRLTGLGASGLAFMRASPAPMEPDAGVTFLIGGFFAISALLADLLAITWRRAALALVPLGLAYVVPAVALGTPMLFSEFAALAIGVALVLFTANQPSGKVPLGTVVTGWLAVAAVTLASLGIVWAAAQALPSFRDRPSNDPLQMNDPSLDLKRNLVQGTTDPVLRYTTDGDAGVYLKLATLTSLSTGGFGLSDVRVASGRFPAPPGLDGPGTERTTHVDVTAFASEWLPVPYAPRSVQAPGRWGFATETLDVMALSGPGRATATEAISYDVRSVDVRPSREQVAGAASTDEDADREITTFVPDEVPQRVRDLAAEVTAGAPTAGAKAQALEAFLLSDRFTYSTGTSTGTGDGLATIDDFLFGSRRGYCEQYAGAMAIMARAVGLPTRMAVGFVPGSVDDSGTWSVSQRDMHTWPEVWLDGWGWVAFEPTPGRGATDPGDSQDAGEGAAPESASPTPTPTPSAEATPTPTPTAAPAPGVPASPEAAGWVVWLLAALLVGALVAGIVAAPRIARARRHARRLAGTGDARADTVSAWDELRDSLIEAGVPWPDGSPRYAAERLVGSVAALGDDEHAAADLRLLAEAAERAMFDRVDAYEGQGRWATEVDRVLQAVRDQAKDRAGAPRRAR